MTFNKISYELDGDIAIVTIADPATLNAAGTDTTAELLLAFEKAGNEARCTILTGEGRGFCSGANLGPTQKSADSAPNGENMGEFDAGAALDTVYHPFIMAMKEHPHPVVTAVNGAAAGVGCSIALMGDIIICAESGYFLQAFRRIGLVPDGGSSYLLPRLIGRARASEMMLMGEKIHSAQAYEWGMVNRVVGDNELMSVAREFAEKLASGPTKALAMTKELVWNSADNSFQEQVHEERLAQRIAGRTSDFKEGVGAFLEKRAAKFTGK